MLNAPSALQGLDDPKLIFQALPVSLTGRTFNLVSNAERVGNATLKRLKLGASFVSGEDSPARSLIIAARANSKRLTCTPSLLSHFMVSLSQLLGVVESALLMLLIQLLVLLSQLLSICHRFGLLLCKLRLLALSFPVNQSLG